MPKIVEQIKTLCKPIGTLELVPILLVIFSLTGIIVGITELLFYFDLKFLKENEDSDVSDAIYYRRCFGLATSIMLPIVFLLLIFLSSSLCKSPILKDIIGAKPLINLLT
jgi:hypothetical protein